MIKNISDESDIKIDVCEGKHEFVIADTGIQSFEDFKAGKKQYTKSSLSGIIRNVFWKILKLW